MIRILLTLLIVLFMVCAAAYAHPPSSLQVSYDRYSKTVKAKIDHPVTNVKTHYVAQVKVFLNGELAIDHKLKSQETESSEFLSYTMPDAEGGDAVRVEAYCSSFGKRFGEIKIER